MVQIPRLREWREARALTQVELAERAGVSSRSVAGYEAGTGARPPTVRKLAEALDVEVMDLMGGAARPKEESRSSLEPSLFNGLDERRPLLILTDALTAAADTWIEAVADPNINIHKRFGLRDAAIELFDRINFRALEDWETLSPENRREIGRAMGKLNEIPEKAYRAMPDETLKEENEERRKKIREWTRRISA